MDLPPAPLYRDERLQNIIPQVPLNQLMMKYTGETEKASLFSYFLTFSGVQNLQRQLFEEVRFDASTRVFDNDLQSVPKESVVC